MAAPADEETEQGMLYEAHVLLKLRPKVFRCRYSCKDSSKPSGLHEFTCIDRLNSHMQHAHKWTVKYPKQDGGRRIYDKALLWEQDWAKWAAKVALDESLVKKPLGGIVVVRPKQSPKDANRRKRPHREVAIDPLTTREDMEEWLKQEAISNIPCHNMGNPPTVRTCPFLCEILSPKALGEESYGEKYFEAFRKKLFYGSINVFEEALEQFLQGKPDDEAKALKSRAFGEFSFFYCPFEVRENVIKDKLTSICEDVKLYASELKARREWEEARLLEENRVMQIREKYVLAKLCQFDALRASTGRVQDLVVAKRHKLMEYEEFLCRELEETRQILKCLNGDNEENNSAAGGTVVVNGDGREGGTFGENGKLVAQQEEVSEVVLKETTPSEEKVVSEGQAVNKKQQQEVEEEVPQVQQQINAQEEEVEGPGWEVIFAEKGKEA
eukprot:c20907_g1_i1 orf=156-1478(+)